VSRCDSGGGGGGEGLLAASGSTKDLRKVRHRILGRKSW